MQDERIWRCLSHLTSLQELHTSHLRLADIPGEVSLLTSLTSLHHKYGLASLGRDLSPLHKLKELYISGSSLGCIPVMTCRSLETLNLEHCYIGPALTWEGLCRLKALPHLRKVTFSRPLPPAEMAVRMVQELPLVDFEFKSYPSAS